MAPGRCRYGDRRLAQRLRCLSRSAVTFCWSRSRAARRVAVNSLLGCDPDLVFRAEGREASINANWSNDRDAFVPCEQDSLTSLRALGEACQIDVPEGLPSALAFLVGYFGYETVWAGRRHTARCRKRTGLARHVVRAPAIAGLFSTISAMRSFASRQSGMPTMAIKPLMRRATGLTRPCELWKSLSRVPQAFRAIPSPISSFRIISSLHSITRWWRRRRNTSLPVDIFQVVLAQRFSTPFSLPPLDLYRALRRINPSPFLYFLDFSRICSGRVQPRDLWSGCAMVKSPFRPHRWHAAARRDEPRRSCGGAVIAG